VIRITAGRNVVFQRDSGPARRWQQWKVEHADALLRSGIPELVLRDEHTWLYYLEHGYFDWFETKDLSPAEQRALYDLLRSGLSNEEKVGTVVWPHLRHIFEEHS
jgi:hypothetical protein